MTHHKKSDAEPQSWKFSAGFSPVEVENDAGYGVCMCVGVNEPNEN